MDFHPILIPLPATPEIAARPRLLLLMPHLGGGGAERVIQILANSLNPLRHDIHLGLLASSQSPLTPGALLPHVTVHAFPHRRIRHALPDLIRLVWRIRPDVLLSGIAHLNFMVLGARPFLPRSTRILIRQNGTITSILHHASYPRMLRMLYRSLYPRANRILCQSEAMACDLAAVVRIPSSRLAVLPNPVDAAAIHHSIPQAATGFPESGPHILAIGRLSHEKGFDMLLDAFSQLQPSFPSASLTILGKGPLLPALRNQSALLGLTDKVHFVGYVEDPAQYFAGASLFVLSSRHEGIPNALLEAAAAGLPIVATPASPGLVELLQHAPGVWLASDSSPSALAGALRAALAALAPGQRFSHPWLQPFLLPNAVPACERILDEVLLRQ